jgi:hypothetical protein
MMRIPAYARIIRSALIVNRFSLRHLPPEAPMLAKI